MMFKKIEMFIHNLLTGQNDMDQTIKAIAKIIAQGEGFYVDQETLWEDHWHWFSVYREKGANFTESSGYLNQQRWYQTAISILDVANQGDFKIGVLEEENESLKLRLDENEIELEALDVDIRDAEDEIESLNFEIARLNAVIDGYEEDDGDFAARRIAQHYQDEGVLRDIRDEMDRLRGFQHIVGGMTNGEVHHALTLRIPAAIERLCDLIDK
jgi:hypothetical protein